jgi:hypothetical protein
LAAASFLPLPYQNKPCNIAVQTGIPVQITGILSLISNLLMWIKYTKPIYAPYCNLLTFISLFAAPKLFIMKKLTILGLLVAISFVSCQKEKDRQDSDNNYHFSFTVDGVKKSYTGYIAAHTDTVSGYVSLTILGAPAVTSFDNYLGIYLDNVPNKGNITVGQYLDLGPNFNLITTYNLNGVEYESGQSVAEDAITDNITIANHFKLNITSMDKTTIRGTFSGDYFKDGDAKNGTKLNITNGDFYVKFL